MNWLLALIALISYLSTNTVDLTSNQQIHLFLTTLSEVEVGFFKIAAFLLVLGIIIGATALRGRGSEGGLGCGCILAIIAVILFIGTGIGYLLTQGMLSGFDPVLGVVDPIKFYLCLILFAVTGFS